MLNNSKRTFYYHMFDKFSNESLIENFVEKHDFNNIIVRNNKRDDAKFTLAVMLLNLFITMKLHRSITS